MAVIATSCKPTLFVSNLESYLNHFQQLLLEWRIAIHLPKSAVRTFARALQRFIQPQPVKILWNQTNRSTQLVIWGCI
jgi:hypothetical protein